MRRRQILLSLITASILSTLLFAAEQKPPVVPPLVEKVEVSVINVDVTATDANGHAVPGLTADDFVIHEDGVPQPITGFYSIENAKVHIAGAASNQPPVVASELDQFRRKIVLLFDNNTLDIRNRDAALKTVEKFIDNRFAGNYEWAVMSVGPTVKTIQPFTDQRTLLDSALLEVRHSPTFQAQREIDRGILSDTSRKALEEEFPDRSDLGGTMRFQSREQTLRNLRSTATTGVAIIDTCRAYSSAAGKKLLVLVTGGMEMNTSFSGYDAMEDRELHEMKREMGSMFDVMVKEANASNFNIYVINAKGHATAVPQHDVSNRTPGYTFGLRNSGQEGGADTSADVSDTSSSSVALASGTGGKYLPSNQLNDSLETIDTDSANYYSLAYSPKHGSDGKYHKISVTSKKPGITVRHREGYVDLSSDERFEQSLRASMSFPKEKGTLPVSLQLGSPAKAGSEPSIPLTAALPMNRVTLFQQGDSWVGRVHVYLTAYDAKGKDVAFNHAVQDVKLNAAEYAAVQQGALFRYTQKIALKKGGAYTLVVTLRDDVSDEIGSAFTDLRL